MMKYAGIGILSLCTMLTGCITSGDRETLASLRNVSIEIKDEKIDASLEKAMQSYQKFLEETPESAMTPEAIRRLADLKIEKEYSAYTDDDKAPGKSKPDISKPDSSQTVSKKPVKTNSKADAIAKVDESMKDFEKRATQKTEFKSADKSAELPAGSADDLQTAGAMEAIQLYKNLLIKYPMYERNDQVLYQLSRAYEETGQVEEAIKVLNRLVKEYPDSRHIDEAQFRRAEYFFTRKRYLDSEEAYQAVLNLGRGSAFYELALYKQGWAFFKQDMYEEALDDFIGLLDYKLSIGYEFEQSEDKIEQKRIEDTYRVISLGFSYLGGAKSVVEYFDKKGLRIYEASIYSHLAEYYLEKRRYADSADTYNTYVERNPMNKVSPYFHIRVIEIYLKGGFPKLVIESKRTFSINYGLRAGYWTFFDINAFPDVLSYLKSNLVDLANHYHAMYQDRRLRKFKADNFKEATHWYREYLASFPEEPRASGMNFQLAELLLQNKDFRGAALEYERTAYDYPSHEKSSAAGYAAVFAYREFLKSASQSERIMVKREVVRSSLRFADAYPKHENAVLVLVAVTDDLYEMKDYELAIKTGRKVIKTYPKTKPEYLRSAWLVVAHASFDITNYKDAEDAYVKVLTMTPKQQAAYADLSENLAASIYKQGEQARLLEDFKTAAEHFLRLAKVTPNSKIRATAEYDGAAALIALKDWTRASQVLADFRKRYPRHEYQHDVTKKLAIVYKEDGKLLLAATEFERIERESKDNDVRREALLQAAELYEQTKNEDRALAVYNRFVKYFPTPIEFVLDTRQKIADIYLKRKQRKLYIAELKTIIRADARAGKERTDRTRYLAGKASLVMVEPLMDDFSRVKLVRPFKRNLNKKKKRMKKAIDAFTRLVDYQVGEVTAAATYYIAEIYIQFSKALMTSERPKKLNELELEQYELVLEEQSFPFEEKSINVHQKNIELLSLGIYNEWIDKSIEKLAVILPARFGKPEVKSEFVRSMVPDQNRRRPQPEKPKTEQKKTDDTNSTVMTGAGS